MNSNILPINTVENSTFTTAKIAINFEFNYINRKYLLFLILIRLFTIQEIANYISIHKIIQANNNKPDSLTKQGLSGHYDTLFLE